MKDSSREINNLTKIQNRFINLFEHFGGNKSNAADACEISVSDHRRWLEYDPEYGDHFKEAKARVDERNFRFALRCGYQQARNGSTQMRSFIRKEYGASILDLVLKGENPIPTQ